MATLGMMMADIAKQAKKVNAEYKVARLKVVMSVPDRPAKPDGAVFVPLSENTATHNLVTMPASGNGPISFR
jgi:hypothetical protein